MIYETITYTKENLEINAEIKRCHGHQEIEKVNSIFKNGKPLDLSEYEVEDIADILDGFFGIDYGNELAEQFYLTAEHVN